MRSLNGIRLKPTADVLDSIRRAGLLHYRDRRAGSRIHCSIPTTIGRRVGSKSSYRSAGCNQSNLVHIDLKNNIAADVNIASQNVRSAGGKYRPLQSVKALNHVTLMFWF